MERWQMTSAWWEWKSSYDPGALKDSRILRSPGAAAMVSGVRRVWPSD
jgi:hypothetical protein